jgi:hypothetical protein
MDENLNNSVIKTKIEDFNNKIISNNINNNTKSIINCELTNGKKLFVCFGKVLELCLFLKLCCF